MKKILIGTSALIGAGLLASHAAHADDKGIKLTVGGFFNTFYILNFDDDRKGVTNDNNDGGLTDVSGAAGLPLPVGYGTTYQGNVYNVRPSAFNNGIAGIPRGFVSDPVVGAGTPVLDNQVPGGNINTDQNSFRHGRYKLRYAVRRNPDGSPATDPVTGRPIIDTYAIYRSRTNRDAGFRANIDSLTNDSEIHFKGETTLDNGLTVGVHVELEGDPKNNQIDQSYAYFKGGFGELHIGNDSDALGKACVTAPGGLGSFGAFSQNGTGSHYEQALGVGSNFNCATINGTATEILYETPEFAGFQLLLSYSPDNGIRSQNSQTFGNGTPYVQRGQNLHEFSAYATYTLEGDGWSLNWGGGGEWGFNSGLGTDSIYAKGYEFDQTEDGHVRHHNRAGPNSYQTGLVGTIGGFKVGGNFQLLDFGLGKGSDNWTAGGGVTYNVDAWTVGFQYAHQQVSVGLNNLFDEFDGVDFVTGLDRSDDRFVLSGDYVLGPGIDVSASVGYTTTTFNDNVREVGLQADRSNPYDSFEVGIGTNIKF